MHAAGLATLYGDDVHPERLLRLWNGGLNRMEHVLAPGQDPDIERPRIVAELAVALSDFF